MINFFTDCFFFVRDLFNENLERKDFEERIVMNQDTFHSLENITTDLLESGEEQIETQYVIKLVRKALCIEDRIQELVFGSKQSKSGNGAQGAAVESSIFGNNSISMHPAASNGETLLLQKQRVIEGLKQFIKTKELLWNCSKDGLLNLYTLHVCIREMKLAASYVSLKQSNPKKLLEGRVQQEYHSLLEKDPDDKTYFHILYYKMKIFSVLHLNRGGKVMDSLKAKSIHIHGINHLLIEEAVTLLREQRFNKSVCFDGAKSR